MTKPVRSGPTSPAILLDHLLDAIDALPSPFSLFDAEGRLVACSRAYREQNGEVLATFKGPLIDGAIGLQDVLEAAVS